MKTNDESIRKKEENNMFLQSLLPKLNTEIILICTNNVKHRGSMTLPEQRCMPSTATTVRMDNIRVIAAISPQYMSLILPQDLLIYL